MARNFIWSWIIAASVVAGTASCSDSHEEAGEEGTSRPRGGDDDDGSGNDDDDGSGSDSDDEPGDDGDPTGGGSAGSGGGNVSPSDLPSFPGSGTSDAGDPLPGGMLCDSVPGEDVEIKGPSGKCFFDKNDPNNPNVAATLEQVLECVEETNTVHIRLTFHPWFVDNTYGANSIGWPARRGHRFNDLTKSDHAEIILNDDAGNIVLRFKLDYVSEDPSAPSGYASLGVMGGDGSVLVGDASAVIAWSTSIDRNFNERGYDEYTPPAGSDVADSPATDEDFSPNPDAPEWDFRVVYEAWIDLAIFGSAGFGGATIEYVHASPAKAMSDTIETTPGDCPPPPCIDNDPDTFCGEAGSGGGGTGGSGGTGGNGGTGGDGGDPCRDNDPDTVCEEGGTAGGGDPQYCADHPDDPGCMVD